MNETETIKEIAEVIAALPPGEHEACTELIEHFRRAVRIAGRPGYLAFALVGAELSQGDANDKTS